ncbi:Hypothetical predicted protein [Octopus vulgaris]|uniref:Uncharacterized protein n=1 Tax=Octopus vulgaris TaxID=6645 RepID=A0AA36FH12_OCTVU|nr:Hypothetical predicted protein [Octopus vulgaris]
MTLQNDNMNFKYSSRDRPVRTRQGQRRTKLRAFNFAENFFMKCSSIVFRKFGSFLEHFKFTPTSTPNRIELKTDIENISCHFRLIEILRQQESHFNSFSCNLVNIEPLRVLENVCQNKKIKINFITEKEA